MEPSTITVTGKGFINVQPDITRIHLTLKSTHKNYKDAYEQAKMNAEKIKQIMAEVSVNVNTPKTLSFDIDKKFESTYDEFGNKRSNQIIEYELDHRLKIDLGMDTQILNKVITNIGKSLKQAEINIGYTIKDVKSYQLNMIENAIKDAKEKASIICESSGCSLGPVQNIQYGVQDIHIFAPGRMIHSSDEAISCNAESFDISPEDLSAFEEVTITWIIR